MAEAKRRMQTNYKIGRNINSKQIIHLLFKII